MAAVIPRLKCKYLQHQGKLIYISKLTDAFYSVALQSMHNDRFLSDILHRCELGPLSEERLPEYTVDESCIYA
jgi:hypothetical protein